MAKNFTEEELHEDPFLRSYAKTQQFYVEHKNIIIGSAVAVILAIALGIGYHFYQQSQNRKAENLMGSAEEFFLQGDYEHALHGSEEDFTVGFEQVINNYGGTQAANLAHYYAAVSEYNLGNNNQALTYIEDYDVPEGILGVAPLSFHAVLLTELGQHAEAADLYVQAAEWDENDSTTPYNYLKAAHAYADAGDTGHAEEYAHVIMDDYPSSSQVPEAQKLLGRLMAANEK